MTKLNEKLNFNGRDIFVGLDVHLNSWNVSVYCEDLYIKSFNQPASPKDLQHYLTKNFPEANYHCAYESGFSGYWIQRQLTNNHINCIVVNAADVPQTDKGSKNKTDKVDSIRLAQALRAKLLRPNFVPDPELEADRHLTRSNEKFKKDLVRIKNRIKGQLYHMGIKIPEQFSNANWSNRFITWLKDIEVENISAKKALIYQINMVEFIRDQKLEVLKEIRKLLKKDRYNHPAKALCSIPGIGPITAAYLLTEIGDIHRFSNFKQLNCFIGFYPSEFSSGEQVHKSHISSRKHNHLRSLLIESAWTAVRSDPAMTMAYYEAKTRVGGKRAIIKMARKLLSRIRYVWISQQAYEKGLV